MSTLASSLMLAALLASTECGEKCDAKSIPVRGTYRLQEPGALTLRSLSMQVDGDTVVVEYEREDGARWKATYHVAERGRTGR